MYAYTKYTLKRVDGSFAIKEIQLYRGRYQHLTSFL
jgi:hypothetical protein